MRWSDAFTTPAPALSGSTSIGLAVDSAGFLGSTLGKFFGRDSFLAALAVLFSTWLGNAPTLPPANWVASAGTELFSKVAPWRDQLHQTIQVNWLCGATGTEENQQLSNNWFTWWQNFMRKFVDQNYDIAKKFSSAYIGSKPKCKFRNFNFNKRTKAATQPFIIWGETSSMTNAKQCYLNHPLGSQIW